MEYNNNDFRKEQGALFTDGNVSEAYKLVEEAKKRIDKEKSEKLLKKIKKNKGFTLNDFKDQILEMEKMGGIEGILSKMPGMGKMPPAMKNARRSARQKGSTGSE